jgi:hypothetical protein
VKRAELSYGPGGSGRCHHAFDDNDDSHYNNDGTNNHENDDRSDDDGFSYGGPEGAERAEGAGRAGGGYGYGYAETRRMAADERKKASFRSSDKSASAYENTKATTPTTHTLPHTHTLHAEGTTPLPAAGYTPGFDWEDRGDEHTEHTEHTGLRVASKPPSNQDWREVYASAPARQHARPNYTVDRSASDRRIRGGTVGRTSSLGRGHTGRRRRRSEGQEEEEIKFEIIHDEPHHVLSPWDLDSEWMNKRSPLKPPPGAYAQGGDVGAMGAMGTLRAIGLGATTEPGDGGGRRITAPLPDSEYEMQQHGACDIAAAAEAAAEAATEAFEASETVGGGGGVGGGRSSPLCRSVC